MKQFKLNVTIEGPFVSSASTISQFGVDNPALRNHEEMPIILGTQILGKLRHFGSESLKALLGKEGKNPQSDPKNDENKDKEWKSPRSTLFISDLTMEANKENLSKITRIQIDTDTETVKQGALQVIETVLAPRETAVFSGDVVFFDDSNASMIEEIKTALKNAYQIGAFRSIGYGKITEVKTEEIQLSQDNFCGCLEDYSRLTLNFKDIFCIAKPKKGTDGNLFESDDIISGGVIKGAIANMMVQGSLLQEYLHNIHISHAKPSDKNIIQRYRTIPVTATLDNGDRVVFLEDNPPKMKIKLKDNDKKIIQKHFSTVKPPRTLRVRSAIDAKKRRSADEALFAYEAIVPFDHVWVFDVNFLNVAQEDREAVKKQFWDTLKNGLYRIGKTDARANVGYLGKTPETETHFCGKAIRITEPQDNQSYKIILETDAEILKTNNSLSETDGLKNAYTAYFEQYKLTLDDFYTEETFAGGEYLKNIFKMKDYLGSFYLPKIITKAGSVFVVTPNNAEGIKTLQEWQKFGLKNLYDDWQESPYVASNGYGEIRIEPFTQGEKAS